MSLNRHDLLRLLACEQASSVAESGDTVVGERDPDSFIQRFAQGVAAGGTVFVADPDWDDARRAMFNRLRSTPAAQGGDAGGRGWLCLPTGGSGGAVKLARHDEETLSAAVTGFTAHFGVSRINVVGLLPLHHVSGFMAWLRTVLTGGTYLHASWPALQAGERPPLPVSGEWFVSLVPTQLVRLLAEPEAVDWLRGFHTILLGGGPAWPELLAQVARLRLPVVLVYGSTETAAMVAAQRPGELASGHHDSGVAMPHARLALGNEGRLLVESPALFRGYWPDLRDAAQPWDTGDLARFTADGRLLIEGRADGFIISGGKKIDPLVVERVLRASGRWRDVVVLGVPDPDWGQRVVACHTLEAGMNPKADIEKWVREKLLPAERPKAFIPVELWPRNRQGKIDRAALVRAISNTP